MMQNLLLSLAPHDVAEGLALRSIRSEMFIEDIALKKLFAPLGARCL